ncbi:C1 family peptidase [Chryseobacterium paludis]|uniref:C1 family peptidase n=1 Tax=Chryseobacterium paludis TaxID=2956784 RepID=UPI0021BF0AAB|nr:C1 family peptidase [Chryseobacterium paludis]
MKNFKIIIAALGLLTFAACERSEENLNSAAPSQEDKKSFKLGARFVDENVYKTFKTADMEYLSLKFKGKNSASVAALIPASYTIASSAIGNQGGEGSCVGWATAYAATSSLEYNFKGISQARSPEYVYNQIKIGSCNDGSYISDALNLIKNQGVCSITEMPYNDTNCSVQPSASQKNAASTHKFTSWATVDNTNIANVKTLLSMNLPIIIGIPVDQAFWNIGNTGWIWKKRSGRVDGGHAVCVIGYDDNKQAFKVQNSWGAGWGSNGYFWIDYSFFAKSRFNTAARAISESYVAYVE